MKKIKQLTLNLRIAKKSVINLKLSKQKTERRLHVKVQVNNRKTD